MLAADPVRELAAALGAGCRARAAGRCGARRLRDERGAEARGSAAAAAARARRRACGRRSAIAGRRADGDRRPGLRQSVPRGCVVRVDAPGDPRRGRVVRRRLGRPGATHSGRDGVGEPDRARSRSRRRGTARTATRSRAFSSSGATSVAREYYYNDSGAQMDRFRASVDAARRGEEPPEDGYQGAYVAELAKEDGDPVPAMRKKIEDSLERFRIHIDSWVNQSEIEQHVAELLPRLDTYEADGTLYARTTAHGDDKDRPLIRSSDGSYLYFAADVAYVKDKFERGFDLAIYVLGADHHGYVARLKAAAAMLGYDPSRVEVLLYQLVHLTRGGEQTKMSKRRGDVVFLDEFIDEIGVDAARWYLVNRGPDQTIEIDVDLAAEKSQKNPVYYVQYAHARIAGILRNAGDAAMSAEPNGPLARGGARADQAARRAAASVAAEAAEKRGPQGIPTYAIRVADDFHRFYHEHRVLESDQQAFRLALCRATQIVIARALDLVGVAAPDSM